MNSHETEQSPHPYLLAVERIVAIAPQMTMAERHALAEWEANNIDGRSLGTCDWPGWKAVFGRLSH